MKEPSNQTIYALLQTSVANNTREHDEIIGHQKESNHRLSKLEMWKARGIGAIVVIMSMVIPLVIYIYQDLMSH